MGHSQCLHVSERSLRYRWGGQQTVKQPQGGATELSAPRSAILEMNGLNQENWPAVPGKTVVS